MPFGIEWDKVESKYNWLAVDRRGAIYAYSFKPTEHTHACWKYYGNNFEKVGQLNRDWGDSTWTTMIAERPQTKGEDSMTTPITEVRTYPYTVQDINWEEIDETYNYLTQDQDGSVWAWKKKPELRGERWMPNHQTGFILQEDFYRVKDIFRVSEGTFKNYRNAIIERPAPSSGVVSKEAVEAAKCHKHANNMLAYAQDAATHQHPWKLWEYKSPSCMNYIPCQFHPQWDDVVDYRRKPQTVTITIPFDVATEFTNLVLMRDCCKVISVAIQEALNNRYD